jgi:phosphoglycolate phosphatase
MMLETLHNAGLQVAVVTSNSSDNVQRILGESSRYLGRIECGAPLLGKSSRFKRIAAHFGTVPEAVMCVGDELRDIQAARRAGFACGAVGWGYASPDTLCAVEPDCFFGCIEDMTHTLISHSTTELA